MNIDENDLKEAAKKLRKLRLTDVGGRKEHPAETVKSIFERGLGGLYNDEAIEYMLRAGLRYYAESKTEFNDKYAIKQYRCTVCGNRIGIGDFEPCILALPENSTDMFPMLCPFDADCKPQWDLIHEEDES